MGDSSGPGYISRELKAQWAAESFRKQYERAPYWKDASAAWFTRRDGRSAEETHKLLLELGPHPSPESVAELLNDSWVGIKCDECGESVPEAVLIGGTDEYGEDRLCGSCLRAGLRALELKGGNPT